MALKILRGEQMIGTVGPKALADVSGVGRAAALAGQAGSALSQVSEEWMQTLFEDARERKNTSDAVYAADVEMKNVQFQVQNNETFETDAAAYLEQAEARDKATLESARSTLSPRNAGLLEVSLTKNRAKMFVHYSEIQRDLERKNAYNALSQNVSQQTATLTNEARRVGTGGLPSLIDDLVLLDNQVAGASEDLKRTVDAAGRNNLDKMRDKLQVLKTNVVGAAIATDAEDIMKTLGQDAAFKYIEDFARTGDIPRDIGQGRIDLSDLDPDERNDAANYAYQALRHQLASTTEARAARSQADADAEANARKAEDLRQLRLTVEGVENMDRKRAPWSIPDIWNYVARNKLDANNASMLFSKSLQVTGGNESVGVAYELGQLLSEIRQNPGRYHAGDVKGLIAEHPDLAGSPGAISQVFSEIATQETAAQARAVRYREAGELMNAGRTLDYGNADHVDFVREVEENGLTRKDGTVIFPGIKYTGNADEMFRQRDTILAFTEQTGIVSKGLKGFFRSAMNDTENMDLVREAAMLYMAVQDKLPYQIQNQIPSEVSAFYGQVAEKFGDGIYPVKAIAEVRDAALNPLSGQRRKSLEVITGSEKPREWIESHLKDAMEAREGWFVDVFGLLPEMTPEMLDEAQRILESEGQRYLDGEMAMKAVVAPRLAAMFQPSRFSAAGRKTFTRQPIEMYYGDADNSVDYVRWQVAEFAEAFFKGTIGPETGLTPEQWIDNYGKREPGGWWLQIDPRTARTEAQPAYEVHYMDADGVQRRIERGGVAQAFRPIPTESIDIQKKRNLAVELDRALKASYRGGGEAAAGLFEKTLDKVPGGKKALLASRKAASDVIDWLRRGEVAQANRALDRWVRTQNARVPGSNLGAKVLDTLGFGD